MWRSSSSAAWRGARRLLVSQRQGTANRPDLLASPSLSQPHISVGCRSFWQSAYLRAEAGAGGTPASSSSALAEQIARDDENARRFLLAATGSTLALIAYVRLQGDSAPKPDTHKHEAEKESSPEVEEVPPPQDAVAVESSSDDEASQEVKEEEVEKDAPEPTDVSAGEEKEAGGSQKDEVTQGVADATGTPKADDEGENGESASEGGEDAAGQEEKEGECGFCAFMKAGPCGEVFTAWEQCVDKAEEEGKSIVDECVDATMKLRDCMGEHMEYYGVVLEAEKEVNNAEKRDAEARELFAQQKREQEAEELLRGFEEALDVARSVLGDESGKETAAAEPKEEPLS